MSASSAGTGNEKIYIHFDKPFYKAGETIWFKAYLYYNGLPSSIKTDLYLQLEDENGIAIDKKTYPVGGASAAGNISLDDLLPQGYYMIRAITKAVARTNPEYVYAKKIFIYNPSVKQKDSIAKKNISLRFFPESGYLIDRIRTQVAFTATDSKGLPLELSGVINSDSAAGVVPFKTLHDGTGRFSFTPHQDQHYTAEIISSGKKYTFPLPPVQLSGVYLKVTDADSGKIFEITRSKKDKALYDTVRLVVLKNNDTIFENLIDFELRETVKGLLKTGNIPSGILRFILLNKEDLPLAERLSFVNNREYIDSAGLVTVKRDTAKRALNNFEINFSDTVQRSFSISVTDSQAQDYPDRENIYSGLLLSPYLRGAIYNPAFYFNHYNKETMLALDNVMLTHGWTRYSVNKIAIKDSNDSVNDYMISISGTLYDLVNNQPVSKGRLGFQIVGEDSTIQTFEIAVDEKGKFRIDSLLFFGDARIYYAYNSANGKSTAVKIQFDKTGDNDFSLAPSFRGNIVEEQLEKQDISQVTGLEPIPFAEGKFRELAPVFIKTKVARPADKINEKYTSFLYRTSGKLVLDNINNPYTNRSMSIIEYLLTNIRTLDIDHNERTFVNKKNFSLQTQKYWKVELLLNENVSNIESAQSITMDEVALIKFYEAGFVGVGSGAPGGAVSVYLKKNEDRNTLTVTNNEKFITYKGYSVTKEFYSPDYSTSHQTLEQPDNRTTLFWKAATTTGNKMKFSFFNNDFSKKLSVILEGVDGKGRLFHVEKVL